MFIIENKKIIPATLMDKFQDPRAGAVVTFEGRVRDHNEGKKVSSLEYQVYKPMAKREGGRIVETAKLQYDILDAFCVHAEGQLSIGDVAVWILVSSRHREAAYQASKYIIDAVKSTVPIWKREHYVNDSPVWVACHQCARGEQSHVLTL